MLDRSGFAESFCGVQRQMRDFITGRATVCKACKTVRAERCVNYGKKGRRRRFRGRAGGGRCYNCGFVWRERRKIKIEGK